LNLTENHPVRQDWVVVCAVGYEPVSTKGNSLPAGNLQGISPILVSARRFWPIIAARNQWFIAEIPYSIEQGIFERRAGNFHQNTENLQGSLLMSMIGDGADREFGSRSNPLGDAGHANHLAAERS